MEKWLVVMGVWCMCALCAILFIRGATAPATRKVRVSQNGQDERERRAQAHHAARR
ncbi:hypothetical protein LMG28688_01090 [Paraburkholderia caffeinitolerans]|uniref:Uncharacterized protein n=1 Tax=Paraburkholderia caffeinitolerans TaxID=1723730 RepID=A0A6J5FI39_9BURK|nr:MULTISPECIES: hypothetical protein [Paraburkholderia]CAB3780670.1 hypothetical protein LMG28688_01090 [Paraburkholderia caffeinitolerans]